MSHDRARRQRSQRGTSLVPSPALRHPDRIIHVVAEGQSTEPTYCNALNTYFGRQLGFWLDVQYETRGLSPLAVAERAVDVAARGPERPRGGAEVSPDPLQEVWAIFDRDQHPDVRDAFALIRRHNKEAKEEGGYRVEAAFSHPSFDLWLLLHFQAFANPQDGSSTVIHEKLREYEAFERFAVSKAGSKAINAERAAQLMKADRTSTAIRNARSLIGQCPAGRCSAASDHADSCDPVGRDPSTDVWRLVESLGIGAT